MKNEVQELQIYFSPFGYLDLQRACQIWDELWLYERSLFEIINEYRESCGYDNYESIDPVYCVLEHILQMARNHIEEVTGYDFLNDFSGSWTEIYTYGNYMCSSYDYSEDAIDELNSKVSTCLDELMQNKWCQYFLTEIGIGLD